MRRSTCLILGTLCCLAGIAAAGYVWEPFDSYNPADGTNWTSGWTETAPTSHTLTINNSAPIKNGDNYLVYRAMPGTGTSTVANGTGRDFDSRIAEGIHTVQMNVRVDEFGDFFAGPDISDRMQIYGDASNASGDYGNYGTWCLMTTATVANDNWYVYNGDRTNKWSSGYLKDTGVPIVPGGVYSLTVKVYPEILSYDLTVSNGTITFTRLNNGFRGPGKLSDRIGFGNKVRVVSKGGTDVQLSYDSIRVFANGAYEPTPANGAVDVLVADPVLSWKTGMSVDPSDPNSVVPVVNPNITGHYLYLSAPNDPNLAITPVFIPAQAEIASYVPTAELLPGKVYTWRVDESLNASGPNDDPNLVKGAVWAFTTQFASPIVDAGSNVVTWLDGGSASVQLDGAIEWFNPQNQIEWTVAGQPAGAIVGFSDIGIEDPLATMNMTGIYDLKLRAKDTANAETEDTVQIKVYANSCEAARAVAGYQRITADLNTDCQVNIDDLSVIAENWLEQNYLLGNVLY